MRIQEISGTDQAGRSADNHYHAFMGMLEAGSDELSDMAWYLSRIGRTDRPLPYKPGEWTLRMNKDGILKVVLSAIRNADAGEFDDDDLRDMLRALRKMGIKWTELDTIERSLDQDTPKESQMRLHELAERISKPSGPERFVTGIGKATIPNPAHTKEASYEGDPEGYDFGPQRRSYEAIKAALARAGMRFDYIGAAKTGPRRDRFVATAPGLMWYKYDSSGNELFINGARMLTSDFVGSTPEEQDAILKSDPADLVWKTTEASPVCQEADPDGPEG